MFGRDLGLRSALPVLGVLGVIAGAGLLCAGPGEGPAPAPLVVTFPVRLENAEEEPTAEAPSPEVMAEVMAERERWYALQAERLGANAHHCGVGVLSLACEGDICMFEMPSHINPWAPKRVRAYVEDALIFGWGLPKSISPCISTELEDLQFHSPRFRYFDRTPDLGTPEKWSTIPSLARRLDASRAAMKGL